MAASVVISINRDNTTLSTCGVAVSAAARATICSNVVCSGIAWRSTTFSDWLRVKRRAEVCFSLGASPELLLRKDGERFSSIPLAGSARRQPDEVLDREAGNRLLASEKDRHEHELVTQAMKEVLRERSSELPVPSSPQLITTPTLWHLATPFEGKANSQENALTLACLLHPTPALSGFPHQAATQVIAELEPFDRELFGGIVGWCDSEGNGEWVVTIRCAKLRENQVRLFAGAGIVPASSPLGEWRETGVKLSTMLNVFGLH